VVRLERDLVFRTAFGGGLISLTEDASDGGLANKKLSLEYDSDLKINFSGSP
jgi:hypothetical protein